MRYLLWKLGLVELVRIEGYDGALFGHVRLIRVDKQGSPYIKLFGDEYGGITFDLKEDGTWGSVEQHFRGTWEPYQPESVINKISWLRKPVQQNRELKSVDWR